MPYHPGEARRTPSPQRAASRAGLSPEWRGLRTPSPPRRDVPHDGDPMGAQAPRFPYRARPITAGPRSRVPQPQRPSSAMHRPASAQQQQRPSTAQMRGRLSDPHAASAQGFSPWSALSSHGESGGQAPAVQSAAFRPTSAQKSPALARYLDEEMDASLAPGPRRKFRPPADGAVSYPLGTSPVNSKVTTIERVRTENGWLREEVEKLRMQLAAETQMHQYRAHAFSQERQALEAKLAQAEQAKEAALKKVSEGSGRVKRREGMLHKVRHEERQRRLIRERVVRRLMHVDLHGAKNNNVLPDWKLFHAGIGHYFESWHRALQKHETASEGEKDSTTDEGTWTSTDDEAHRTFMPPSPRAQRRDVRRRLKRLDRQRKHLMERGLSKIGGASFISIEEAGCEGEVATENVPGGLGGAGGPEFTAVDGSAASRGLGVDAQKRERAKLRKHLSSRIPGLQEEEEGPAAAKLTEREDHFLEVAATEIFKRKQLERAWQEKRIEMYEAKRQLDVHLSAAFEHLAAMLHTKQLRLFLR